MKEKIYVGLDIGTTKVCAIVGKQNEYGKLEIMGMGRAPSLGVKRGEVINIEKTVGAITEAIQKAKLESGFDRISKVTVGIAGDHIQTSTHPGLLIREERESLITKADLKRLTNDMYKIYVKAGTKIIHVIPQSYTVDYTETNDPIGMTGSKLEGKFHVITANKQAIEKIEQCVERAGLETQSLVLEPVASGLSVLSDDENQEGVCLVDIGGGTTDITVFHEGIMRYANVIPIGGESLTQDIREGLKILEKQAEMLKTTYGRALHLDSKTHYVAIPGIRNRPAKEISVNNLTQIIKAKMEALGELIHKSLISSGYQKRLSAGIVLTGGGALLENLGQLISLTTGEDSRLGYPNEYLGPCKDDDVKSPMYATSVGLILYAIEQNINDSNSEEASSFSTAKKAKSYSSLGLTQVLKKCKKFLMSDYDEFDENE